MKKQKHASRYLSNQSRLMLLAALNLASASTVTAQTTDGAEMEEVVVSARRQEEVAQEIPISMTIVEQETLSNSNVFSSVDLKQFAPSLSVNTRFGPDQASFAIRGFTQELRTTASVGFYFAEVVAPRGGGSITSGDGAGPGAFFDLQNVMVLKGPQGTLFGRNTTGGAIMLTPQEPTYELEGYLEGSAGNYDMQRLQGVVNVPISDTVRARFGVDKMERDGYLDNMSGVGPDELGNTDYISARASVIWEVTDVVQNYTIFSYTNSENKGIVSSLFACQLGIFGNWLGIVGQSCSNQLAHQGDDFYAVESLTEDPTSELKQWQLINTTTWEINDGLSIKNIFSYANMDQTNGTSVYGISYDYFGQGSYGFTESGQIPGMSSNSQSNIVEELQFQGDALDGDLNWQAGLYFENSRPDEVSGSQSLNQIYCSFYDPNDPASSNCVDIQRSNLAVVGRTNPFAMGGISKQAGEIEYTTYAAYTETTYDLTDQWKVTGGLRYTKDKTEATITDSRSWVDFPYAVAPVTAFPVPGLPGTVRCTYNDTVNPGPDDCRDKLDQSSEAVTGLIDVDYFLTQDVMLYAKYARGYRMGSINMFGGEPYRKYDPEQVDAYELGSKTSFAGVVPGTFNIALFYNELDDQQIQIGYRPLNGDNPTTGIDNAGKSIVQGGEIETSLMLRDDLMLNLSYTYLDTELKEFTPPPAMTANGSAQLIPSSIEGESLTFSPRHSLVANLNYQLPLPVDVGNVSVGVTYSFTDEQLSTAPEYMRDGRPAGSPYALLDSYEIFNFNANWTGILNSDFDGGLFLTNAFDEEYTTYVSGLYNSVGFETRMTGVPKMWGARIRYNFGS